jgi:Xaa-Pro aminopeptidase
MNLQSRVLKLRAELAAKNLDAFISVQNARYLSGTTAAAAVIVSDEGPVLLCSRLEFDRAKRETTIEDIQAYFPRRVPLRRDERVYFGEFWQLLAERLKRLNTRKVGYDGLRRETLQKLQGAHKADYLELPELITELRKIKSTQEISWLRKAAGLAVEGMARATEFIDKGRSEIEIAAEAEYAMRRKGSEGTSFSTIVASGENSWLPHATATSRRLREGELIVVDLGATYKGYASDMTRTFSLRPTSRQLRLLSIVKRAEATAVKRVRSGVKAESVDMAAREVISRAGYGQFCSHGTGHGVGLEIHEAPSLAPGSKDILRTGMVITVEPGIYVPKIGGVRFEDMALVTKKSCEILTG